eukprot:scaffold1441_cov120-Isochrysis_galbana.AAC.4
MESGMQVLALDFSSVGDATKKKILRRERYPLAARRRKHTVRLQSDCRPAAFCGGMVSELRALQQPGLRD